MSMWTVIRIAAGLAGLALLTILIATAILL